MFSKVRCANITLDIIHHQHSLRHIARASVYKSIDEKHKLTQLFTATTAKVCKTLVFGGNIFEP